MTTGRHADGRARRAATRLALPLLAVAYAVHLHQDIRLRDAFTWMDPIQYFSFARDWLGGAARLADFAVATVYPLFIAPFLRVSGTIPAALSSNLLWAVLLAGALLSLRRRLDLRVPPALLLLATFSSPLLFGLSRELYSELCLSALVAWQFVLWLRCTENGGWPATLAFGALLALGCATKMTYPVFLAGPFLAEGIARAGTRDMRSMLRWLLLFTAPAAAVAAAAAIFLPKTLSYYLSIGNTRIPAMRLIGPPTLWSLDALTYYPEQLVRTVFLLLTPVLAFSLVRATRLRAPAWRTVWLWFLGPLVLFTLEVVKEPRHIAPAVAPGMLLLFAGIETLARARARRLAWTLVAALAAAQYALCAAQRVPVPYLMTRALHPEQLVRTLRAADPASVRVADADEPTREIAWLYTRSLALSGFTPNESLALAAALWPAVVYDLDLWRGEEDPAFRLPQAFEHSEDLYLVSMYNLYNRRCNWRRYYVTLSRRQVLEHADFVLVRNGPPPPGAFEPAATIPGAGGEITVYRAAAPRVESYRAIYAREFLRRGRSRDPADVQPLIFSVFVDRALRGPVPPLRELLPELPGRPDPGTGRRNIFHIEGYDRLLPRFLEPYAAYMQQQ
jgi:4-amino-4-deoxy-L-arabinose transferase-like glycosyltransferase